MVISVFVLLNNLSDNSYIMLIAIIYANIHLTKIVDNIYYFQEK